ncbi:MAG: hypothetical protein GX594_00590 [Pirellulaceae bacterium]|nr:hypothetical protein [Pirellulaceae bacterium]
MNQINKPALRAAVLIHERLAGNQGRKLPTYLPEYSWQRVLRFQRQILSAHQRGWHRAAERLTADLADAVDDCCRELAGVQRDLQAPPAKRHVYSAADVYRDILALYDEFEEVDIDLDEHTISVATDSIVLERVRLGAFDICLDWRRLGTAQPYRVVALDPNPAAKSNDITHPHVQDEQLCEGEGRTAVRAALAEGRLFDFFLIVSQLLQTYGKGSAYVELSNWGGVPCTDCGGSVDEDDRYFCLHCDAALCSGCAISCGDCGEYYCSDCIQQCAACGGDYCLSCLTACTACRKRLCADCLEAGLCRACHNKQRRKEKDHDSPQNDALQPAATRPGQSRQSRSAAVPA